MGEQNNKVQATSTRPTNLEVSNESHDIYTAYRTFLSQKGKADTSNTSPMNQDESKQS
ncbi:hypothetical protein NHP190002_05730 [Helicobacter ailurogastricus]|nr:hypothetical protein NHP190002_05730 [Helicobacter ailurogastricus]